MKAEARHEGKAQGKDQEKAEEKVCPSIFSSSGTLFLSKMPRLSIKDLMLGMESLHQGANKP